jgi:hypothetical protein
MPSPWVCARDKQSQTDAQTFLISHTLLLVRSFHYLPLTARDLFFVSFPLSTLVLSWTLWVSSTYLELIYLVDRDIFPSRPLVTIISCSRLSNTVHYIIRRHLRFTLPFVSPPSLSASAVLASNPDLEYCVCAARHRTFLPTTFLTRQQLYLTILYFPFL